MPEHTVHALRGLEAENRAACLLQQHGYRICVRNFRCRRGEIDIIASRGSVLAFIEVRMRTSARFGGAAASIGAGKQKRVVRAARYFLLTRPANQGMRIRFDTIVMEQCQGSLHWVQDAFRPP